MVSRARSSVAPVYLLLCLILGGSSQGVFANMLLQLVGVAILAWAAVARPDEVPKPAEAWLFGCILLGLAVILLQIIPLPPSIWQHLPGRGDIVEGFRILGLQSAWLPISLSPYDSFATLLKLIPPLAILAALLRLGARPAWVIVALLFGTMAGIILGALQVSSADPANSPWYLYADTNLGVATGFFANANHMAILLVIALPFLAALVASSRQNEGVQRYSAIVALAAGAALVIAVGLALNGSLAGFGLVLPVVVASAMILTGHTSPIRRWMLLLSGLLLVAAIAVIAVRPIGTSGLAASAESSVQSRETILRTSLAATRDMMPVGSGVGTFENVYQLYEDHERLDPTTVVNHAHNDYVEIALETGIPGLIALALFLGWWIRMTWAAWRSEDFGPYAKAATIASAAILAHSLVDFPLRTAAISGCFAMCLALLAMGPPRRQSDPSELWPTRHVVVG